MNLHLTEREEEVLRLHELEKVPFRVLAEKYGVTQSRASQIFHDADRKRRQAYQQELQRQENKREITVTLTRGELLMLHSLLDEYMHYRCTHVRATVNEMEWLNSDPRYLEAKRLKKYFLAVAKEK